MTKIIEDDNFENEFENEFEGPSMDEFEHDGFGTRNKTRHDAGNGHREH